MAFPTIPTAAAGRVLSTNQADTSGTRTFPSLSSLTKNAGDLLIAIIVAYQNGGSADANFSSWGGGFTEFYDNDNGAATMSVGAAYKVSTGSETGTFSVTQAATVTGHASMYLLSIPGANRGTAPEAGGQAWGTSAAADPASFNPSGWDVEDTLWISVVGSGMTSGTGSWTGTGTTAPANFTDRSDSNTTDNSTVGQTEAAVAFRQQAAASQDAGTAGVDTSNARNTALVIAVRPPIDTTVTPGAASLTLTAAVPTVTKTDNKLVTPGAASLATTRYAPTVSTPRLVTPGAASLALTPAAPTVSVSDNKRVEPGAASLTLTPAAPTVSVSDNKLVTPGAASLTLTPAAPTVSTPRLVTPGDASLTLTPAAPTVTATDHKTVVPGAALLTLTPHAPTVTTTADGPVEVEVGAASLTLTTYAPTVTVASPPLIELVLEGLSQRRGRRRVTRGEQQVEADDYTLDAFNRDAEDLLRIIFLGG